MVHCAGGHLQDRQRDKIGGHQPRRLCGRRGAAGAAAGGAHRRLMACSWPPGSIVEVLTLAIRMGAVDQCQQPRTAALRGPDETEVTLGRAHLRSYTRLWFRMFSRFVLQIHTLPHRDLSAVVHTGRVYTPNFRQVSRHTPPCPHRDRSQICICTRQQPSPQPRIQPAGLNNCSKGCRHIQVP